MNSKKCRYWRADHLDQLPDSISILNTFGFSARQRMPMPVWVGRPWGPSRRVGRVLTKAVVLPQTMQSPSHYSAVFQREAAQVIRDFAWPDSGEEEEKIGEKYYVCCSRTPPSPRDM